MNRTPPPSTCRTDRQTTVQAERTTQTDRTTRTTQTDRTTRTARTDRDRGQTELLGAILLFGLVISLVVLIQVAAVPTWNQQLEFEHSQRASEDLQRLGQVLSDVAADGGDRSSVVEVGVRYPQRPFLFNPAPPTGRLSTGEPATLTIENSRLDGVDNYWSASETFETRAIEYDASYNEYRNAPTTTYEYGLLVDTFPNGFERPTRTLPLINGTNVNLLLVDGELSGSTSGTVSVPIEGTSAPSTGVTLTGTDDDPSDGTDPIVITLPTERPDVWVDQLADERNVERVTPVAGGVEIELDGTKTYTLKMAEVAVGSGGTAEGAAYITTRGDPARVVARNTSNELVVEVRDRFNNPVAGQEVSFAITGGTGATLADTTATTGVDGQASVFLTTEDDATVTVEATVDGGGAARTATFTVDVVEGGIRATGGTGDGGGAEDGVSGVNPETIELTDVTAPSGMETTLTFDNNLPTQYRVSALRVSYYFNGQQDPPASLTYTGDGSVITVGESFADGVVAGPTLRPTGAAGQVQTLTFDLSGVQGNTWNTDFFVLSIKFANPAGETITYSYFVAFQ